MQVLFFSRWSPSPQERRLRMHQNLPFFMKNQPKMAPFWSKIEIFGFRQAVEDPPPIMRVLDPKEQDVEAHRSRKVHLQNPYAPKFAIFPEKSAKNGRFLVKN